MPEFEISVSSDLVPDNFADVVDAFKNGDLDVALTHRKPDGPYASLEWLMPTAIILGWWTLKPYLQEFSKTSGKLHAQALHGGLSKLWEKAFGPKRSVRSRILVAGGKSHEREVFSGDVSVESKRSNGGRLTLLFRHDTTSEDFRKAVEGFESILAEHHATSDCSDGLSRAIAAVPYLEHPNWQVLVAMDPTSKEMELVDYVKSSQQRKLVVKRIHK